MVCQYQCSHSWPLGWFTEASKSHEVSPLSLFPRPGQVSHSMVDKHLAPSGVAHTNFHPKQPQQWLCSRQTKLLVRGLEEVLHHSLCPINRRQHSFQKAPIEVTSTACSHRQKPAKTSNGSDSRCFQGLPIFLLWWLEEMLRPSGAKSSKVSDAFSLRLFPRLAQVSDSMARIILHHSGVFNVLQAFFHPQKPASFALVPPYVVSTDSPSFEFGCLA